MLFLSRVLSLEDPAKRRKSGNDSPDNLLSKEGKEEMEKKNRNRVWNRWAPFLSVISVAFFSSFRVR